MSVIMEEIPKVKQNPEEKSSSILESKPFYWDRIISYIASTIFGLSVSGVIVDFFKSDEYSLACFSPLENRAQNTYINSYCHKDLPVAEYFPVALATHTAALIVPHYLWKILFSAQFDTFFSHAAKIETLRKGDTGKYPSKNYTIASYLQREFGDGTGILRAYILKLVFQFFLAVIAIAINIVIFTEINTNITFQCYDYEERSQLFGTITCAYPKKLYINVLQVFDYILLVIAMMILGFGLCWCLLYNHSTEYNIAKFCYESSIDAEYYSKPSKTLLSWRQMKNDFNFLLASLLATNSGLRRVFKTIHIENIIFQMFDDDMKKRERFDSITYSTPSDIMRMWLAT